MKNTKKSIITGTMIAGAVFGTISMNASETNLFKYNELGSGSSIRANLLNQSEIDSRAFILELSCGEDASKATPAKKTEDKSKEAKCGEGKCGDSKTTKATDTKADSSAVKTTTTESKTKEGKCGEGKCGVE